MSRHKIGLRNIWRNSFFINAKMIFTEEILIACKSTQLIENGKSNFASFLFYSINSVLNTTTGREITIFNIYFLIPFKLSFSTMVPSFVITKYCSELINLYKNGMIFDKIILLKSFSWYPQPYY